MTKEEYENGTLWLPKSAWIDASEFMHECITEVQSDKVTAFRLAHDMAYLAHCDLDHRSEIRAFCKYDGYVRELRSLCRKRKMHCSVLARDYFIYVVCAYDKKVFEETNVC